MSTNIDEETKTRALDCGMDFFLPKPFTLKKFIDTIRMSRDPTSSVDYTPTYAQTDPPSVRSSSHFKR